MASNYYKMPEVMDKLGKSEQEVQDLIKQGKLRQYLDAGKPVFKTDEVDKLAEEIVGLDLTDDASELGLELEESGEISLEPDDDEGKGDDKKKGKGPKESEGGFGLSQMGDLTMADTNVGTVGLNILSGTDDAYKLTEDTKAETMAGDLDEDDLDSLDADSNLESFGSGSGLLDLSLQADDTSLGAVLDDILPSGAEGGDGGEPVADGADLVGEAEDLDEPDQSAGIRGGVVSEPVGAAPAGQMIVVVPEDPASTLFGAMMFFPVAAMILAGIVLTAAIRDVTPSLTLALTGNTIADISMIWYVVGGLGVIVLLLLMFSAMGGSKAGGGEKKAAKPKKEKMPKKKKK